MPCFAEFQYSVSSTKTFRLKRRGPDSPQTYFQGPSSSSQNSILISYSGGARVMAQQLRTLATL